MTLHCQYISTKLPPMLPPISSFRFLRAIVGLVLFLGLPGPLHAQDSPSVDVERDWLEYYYERPEPGKFVQKMREYSRDGTLMNESARPALIGFISQLIRQNRDKVDEWFTELRGLPPAEMQILLTGMLYSRTAEADAVLQREFGEQFEAQKKELPKILEMQLDKTQTLDMLWGFFYATGSENALRRVIACFNFIDAPENPDFADVPEGFRPLYTNLPEAAAWTLASNAQRHPKVRQYCKKLLAEEDALSPAERKILEQNVMEALPPALR